MDTSDDSGLATWQRACTGPAFMRLKLERFRLVRALMLAYLAAYLGLAVFCGFARNLAGTKVLGPLNLGYAFILGNYLLAWVLAVVYMRHAGRRHDTLAARAIEEGAPGEAGALMAAPLVPAPLVSAQ